MLDRAAARIAPASPISGSKRSQAIRSTILPLSKRRRLAPSYEEDEDDDDETAPPRAPVPKGWNLVTAQGVPLDPTVGDTTYPWLTLDAADSNSWGAGPRRAQPFSSVIAASRWRRWHTLVIRFERLNARRVFPLSALEARPHLLRQLYLQELRMLERLWARNYREARAQLGRPGPHSLSVLLSNISLSSVSI